MAKKKIARRGEVWSINDINTRGHNSLILKGNKNSSNVFHLPITHATHTRRMRNVKLHTNPNKNESDDSYILPKVQKSKEEHLGRKSKSLKIKDPIDKSIRRHIEKKSKKNR